MTISTNFSVNSKLTEVINKTKHTNSENLKPEKFESKTKDSLINTTNKSKNEAKIIDFDKLSQVENKSSEKNLSIVERISESAMEDADNKVSYKDKAILDYGNLACAYAVSHMLNKLPEFKSVNQMECARLAQTLQKKGFDPVYNPKLPEKKEVSDFREGDVVFFPRETEQYGLKKMGHVGIVSKDKTTGELMLVNNCYSGSYQGGQFIVENGVKAVSLEKYLSERNVSMILRHK